MCANGNKVPVRMPSATPRGTDRRVKRHSDGARIRCATGFRRRLRAMCSRGGMCRRTQAPIAEDAPTSAAIPEQAPLDPKSGGAGKRVSVRVDLGGRRLMKKKKKKK